ncbi:MAG TPA: NAD(P)(+) transhydrogenase (Re/Si-specific) subunit beta, partial [Polyangiaceae bacterium]|nr:NAD(P)(+) transhydrogenase (Re/Si-specific) subunit beta [Polyangiaceae bacterium]
MDQFINFSYLIASVCFILALQGLSSPKHARKGIFVGVLGMAVAVGATLFHHEIVSYTWIIPGLVIGSLIGAAMSIWIPMTKMPERIALSHSFGGLAAALVGVSEYYTHGADLSVVTRTALGLEVFLGFLTFTGSLMAFGKLQGFITGAPVTYKFQNFSNIG